MKKIYLKLWNLAKKYYLIGRPMDVAHITWMIKDALLVCKKEKLDESLLLPLVILHDVGYAKVPKQNPFNLDLRKAHMKFGAKIARKILTKLKYPKNKTNKIVHYVSIHDNWAFGQDEIYLQDKILGTFSDLDYIWMATKKGFPALMKILNKNPKEMIQYLQENDKPIKRPFCTKTTKKLYEKYLKDRTKNQIKGTIIS